MKHVFRLGPLDLERDSEGDGGTRSDGEVFVFAAADPDGTILGPVIAAGDEEGLRRLQTEAPGASFVCEPTLADAAATLGLTTAPLSLRILNERALLALDFAMWPVVDENNAPALLANILKASVAFAEAEPWDRWPNEVALEITVEGAIPRVWEGVVFGPQFESPGFLLYPDAGTVARMAARREPDQKGDFEAIRSIGLLLADEPEYAREALAALGVWFVPHVHNMAGNGQLEAISDPDLHAVLAIAGALGGLEDGERESSFELDGLRARVRVPDGVNLPSEDDDVDFGMEYDPAVAPDPERWLAMDEQARMTLVERHHARAGSSEEPDANPRVHAVLHTVIESQIAMGHPRTVASTLQRLIDEGLSRHDAIHAACTATLRSMSSGKVFDEEAYERTLEAITADWWRAGGVGDPKPRKN